MIPAIQLYLQENADKWLGEGKRPLYWRPLLRSNVNYNFVENYPLITRVVFWFAEGDYYPVLISKIMDESIDSESIDKCIKFQEGISEKLGHPLFPRIFGMTEISRHIVLFEEAMRSPTYETQLKRAICGPERSLAHFKRVIQCQFSEMGALFGKLQGIRSSEKTLQWGSWANRLGQDFKKACGSHADCLTAVSISEMGKAIDSVPMYSTPVLADLVCPNIFPGPRFIDNIDPRIGELNSQLPGVINAFRFLVTYFYSPPVKDLFNDWLYAIAVAITDTENRTIIGPPVREMLRQIGLNPDDTDVTWAFVMAAALFEMKDKLEFYGESPFMIRGKKDEFRQWADRMVKIQRLISRNKRFDPRPVILAQERLQTQGKPAPSTDFRKAVLNLFPVRMRPSLVKLYMTFNRSA